MFAGSCGDQVFSLVLSIASYWCTTVCGLLIVHPRSLVSHTPTSLENNGALTIDIINPITSTVVFFYLEKITPIVPYSVKPIV